MKKYSFIAISILFFAIPLFSCNKNDTDDEVKIGISIYNDEDIFISDIIGTLTDFINADTNISTSISSANNNQYIQNDDIDKFIEEGIDIICINIVDRRSSATIINKAKKANIPIIFFNREPVYEDMLLWNKTYYIGAVAKESGTMQSSIIGDLWSNNKDSIDINKDSVVQYILLEGELGHQDTIIRSKYCIKDLDTYNIKSEKIESVVCDWNFKKAYEEVLRLINTYDNIEVIFSNNDTMALGAIKAFKEEDIDIPIIIGVDGIKKAIESIEDRELYGTVINDSSKHSKEIYNLITMLIENKDLKLESNYIWISQESIIQK